MGSCPRQLRTGCPRCTCHNGRFTLFQSRTGQFRSFQFNPVSQRSVQFSVTQVSQFVSVYFSITKVTSVQCHTDQSVHFSLFQYHKGHFGSVSHRSIRSFQFITASQRSLQFSATQINPFISVYFSITKVISVQCHTGQSVRFSLFQHHKGHFSSVPHRSLPFISVQCHSDQSSLVQHHQRSL